MELEVLIFLLCDLRKRVCKYKIIEVRYLGTIGDSISRLPRLSSSFDAAATLKEDSRGKLWPVRIGLREVS